jgi:hypothetical protein
MKQFFIKLATLVGIVLFLSLFFRLFFPKLFIKDVYNAKMVAFDEQKSELDVVMLGTSRTTFGISPSTFSKKIFTDTKQKWNAFSCGMAGASLGETVALCKKMIKDKDFKGKYILFELTSVTSTVSDRFCGEKNLHTNRNVYWMDFDMLKFSNSLIWSENTGKWSFWEKIHFSKNFCVHYIHNVFNVSMFEDALKIVMSSKILSDYGYDKHGFQPLEDKKTKKRNAKQLNKWINKKLKPMLKSKYEINEQIFSPNSPKYPLNESYYHQLTELIEMGKQAGKNVIFFAPPLLYKKSAREIQAVYQKMPEKNTFGIYEKTRKYTYTMGVFSIFDFYKYENTKSIFLFIEIFTVVKGEMLLTFHLILDVY